MDNGFHVGGPRGLGDDFLNGPAALVFKFHRDVTCVRFRNRGQSQLQAGPPGSTLHLWNGMEHLLNVRDHSVGFSK